jgi:hypothetical protein
MQFLLMIYADESAVESAGNDEVARTLREYAAFTDALQRAGAYVGSNRLRETGRTSTVPCAAPGQRSAHDNAASRSGTSMR